MFLKQEIETWVLALEHYDRQDFDEALRVFDSIADTSKILFNCGVIYATLGEHERAVECYQRAIGLDQYLAIAYFQQGVSNFLLGDFEEALANFNDTLLYLRGNTSIDYDQLGLKFRLFSCEVLFNRGLCYIYLRQFGPGMQDLEYASKEKVTPDHDVINDAIREQAEGYTVFSIPVGVVYRPNEAKVKNLKTKDYLGKARLIAASSNNNHPQTHGHEIQRSHSVLDTRLPENPPFAVSHLVQKNLSSSRSRQHSEPPLNRNLFPPTPPPDADKASTHTHSSSGSTTGLGRPASVRAGRPPRLDLERPGALVHGQPQPQPQPQVQMLPPGERPRIGTTRTASEPRGFTFRGHARGSSGSDHARREMGHRRGASDTGFAAAGAGYVEDGYGMYPAPRAAGGAGAGATSGTRRSGPRMQERYIDEEEEYASDAYDDGGVDVGDGDGDFEIVAAGRPASRSHSHSQSQSQQSPVKGPRRRPEVRKFRVKVHSYEDTRYIVTGPRVSLSEFEGRIRDKFGFRSLLKIRMHDEGDMVTMVDQEDLDLLMSGARDVARREGSEMGKMEIWVEEQTMI